MARGNACRGCGRTVSKWSTWCHWCRPVHITRATVAAIGDDDEGEGTLQITLVPGSKPRVVYIHPGPAALIAQAIKARNWMPPGPKEAGDGEK